MAESPLIPKALETIEDARHYLNNRASGTQDIEEQTRIRILHDALEEWTGTLRLKAVTIVPREEPPDAELSKELSETQRQIKELHEWLPFDNVNRVMSTLLRQVQMLAGPHGPGGGKPR